MENFAPDVVIAKFKKDPAMQGIVTKLSENGHYSIDNVLPEKEQAAYDLVVAAQAKFEQAIVDGFKSGEIASAVAVVHTGGPCNPLTYKTNNRTAILENLLKAGGIVACVYQEKNKLCKTCIPGGTDAGQYLKATERFNNYKERYSNLEDYPVADLDNDLTRDFSGASYLVKTKDGNAFFYSFQSFQVQTIGKSSAPRRWAVWAGQDNPNPNKEALTRAWEVLTRKWDVNFLLKHEAGISLDTMLARGCVNVPGVKNVPEPQ